MHIKNITALIPASFVYTYTNSEGQKVSDSIEMKLRRVSFSVANDQLRAIATSNGAATPELCKAIAEIVAEWNIYTDEAETEMLSIDADWFAGPDCPADFFGQIVECVFAKLNGDPQKASGSRNGSQPEAKSSPALVAS